MNEFIAAFLREGAIKWAKSVNQDGEMVLTAGPCTITQTMMSGGRNGTWKASWKVNVGNSRAEYFERLKDAKAFCEDDLQEAVRSPFETQVTVDWGSGRGQGRRSGGTVKGSMADPPRGQKTYTDPVGKLNLSREERAELALADSRHWIMDDYVKARAAGLNHDQAMISADPTVPATEKKAAVERLGGSQKPAETEKPAASSAPRYVAKKVKGVKFVGPQPGTYTLGGNGYGVLDTLTGRWMAGSSRLGQEHQVGEWRTLDAAQTIAEHAAGYTGAWVSPK